MVPEAEEAVSATRPVEAEASTDVGCDVPSVLRVVVCGGGPAEIDAVARDVGRPSALTSESPAGVPRLLVSFVDGIATSALGRLDGGSVGYSGGGLYALRKDAVKAFFEQGSEWGAGSIVCRRGLRRIPFLSAAVDLAALAAGWAPLHASAWETPEGVGVIASGWAHCGKTGALLAAYQQGARPIGDDRVLLSPVGDLVVGLGRPVQAKDWHVAQLPELRRRVGGMRRVVARAGFAVATRRRDESASRWGRLVDRALTKARGASKVELDLADAEESAPSQLCARPRLLLLMETHGGEHIVAEPADPESVAPRLAAHARADLIPTLRAQLAYDYAHPDAGWRDVHRAPEMVGTILERAVRGIPAWIVRHPYPCSLEQLHAVTSELAASVART